MLSSVFAHDLRSARRNRYAHRVAHPVVDLRPRVVNPLTGRNVLEYVSTHRSRMLSGDMEGPGGFDVIDGLLIRLPDGGATSVSIPVAFRLRCSQTDEILNNGKTFVRNISFSLPRGV
jgi:hypothetical protein